MARARAARSAAARLARGAGAALVIHAAWYLGAGTWHGFGDGVLLRRELGDAHIPVALVAGAVAVAMAYLGARAVLGVLAAMVPGGRAARIAGTAAAAILAGVLQLGLAAGEVQLRRDETYGRIMQRERDRIVERELAEWQRAQRARAGRLRGRAPREGARAGRGAPRAAVRARARRAHGARDRRRRVASAAGAGGLAAPAPSALIGAACAAAIGSVLLVIALDAMFV